MIADVLYKCRACGKLFEEPIDLPYPDGESTETYLAAVVREPANGIAPHKCGENRRGVGDIQGIKWKPGK